MAKDRNKNTSTTEDTSTAVDTSIEQAENQEAVTMGAAATVAEVETATVATSETAAEETPASTESIAPLVEPIVETQASETTAVTSPIDLDLLSMFGRALADNVIAYEAAMKPGKPLKESDGAMIQRTFSTTLFQIANDTSDGDFELLFPWLLQRFADGAEGVYHPDYVFRFIANVPLSKEQREAFMRFVNLIRVTANSATRELVKKQVNFSNVLEFVFTDKARTRIQTFYRLS